MIKELQNRLKQTEQSEQAYKEQVEKLVALNREADKRYYALEQSKQEMVKMRDNDYEAMKNKNTKLKNELKTLQKYFEAKVHEIEDLEKTNQ